MGKDLQLGERPHSPASGEPALADKSLAWSLDPGFKSQPCQLLWAVISSPEKDERHSVPGVGCWRDENSHSGERTPLTQEPGT